MTSSSLQRRAALIAACIGATAAVGATPALAATINLPGTTIYGSGSSLQVNAQNGSPNSTWLGLTNVWSGSATDQKFTEPGPPSQIYQLENGKAVYTSSSSGKGLNEFGDVTGSVALSNDPTANGLSTPVLDAFIGTDDPPTATNLQEGNTASGGVDQVTVPVFQAPVALMLSLPSGLTIGPKGQVKLNATLVDEIYENSIPAKSQTASGNFIAASYPANSWGALLLGAGLKVVKNTVTPTATQFTDQTNLSAGDTLITREVRNGGSGTTYATQGYLSLAGDTAYTNFSDNEALWPTTDTTDGCPSSGGTGSCASDTYAQGDNAAVSTGNTGSSQLVKNTLADPGTIGYANLADAALDAGTTTGGVASNYFTNEVQTSTYDGSASHQFLFAAVQNDYDGTQTGTGSNTVTYADPGVVTLTNAPSVTVTANLYDSTNVVVNTTSTSDYTLANGTTNGVGEWFDVSGTYGDSFGGTLAGDPNVAKHGGTNADYPIAAATYDVGWSQYDGDNLPTSGYYNTETAAQDIGNSAISFFAYEAGTGQANLSAAKIGFQKLPTPIDTLAKSAWESITN